MKIKKVLSILCVLVLVFTALAGCSQQPAAAEPAEEPAAVTEAPAAEAVTEEVEEDPGYDTEKVYEIKLTSNDPITAIWMQQIQAATERIKERTNGKVDIQVYASGEMLVGDEGIEAVMSNTAVFYFIAPSAFADYVPVYKTICAPYLWESYEDVEKFMETDMMADMDAEANAAGIHGIVTNFVVGCRNTLANVPINTVDDFKGLKIRVPNNTIYADLFGAMGANYMAMAFSEVFSAMETGMIEAVEVTPGNAVPTKLWEALKTPHYSLTKHLLNVVGLFTGEEFWQSLPEPYRVIIQEELNTAALTANQEVGDQDASLIQEMVDAGVVLVEPDLTSFQEAFAPVGAQYFRFDEVVEAVRALD